MNCKLNSPILIINETLALHLSLRNPHLAGADRQRLLRSDLQSIRGRTEKEIRRAIRFNILDSTIALNAAFFVNAAILILAASTFYKAGMHDVEDIMDAHKLL